MNQLAKILIITGIILVIAGLIIYFAGDKLGWIGFFESHFAPTELLVVFIGSFLHTFRSMKLKSCGMSLELQPQRLFLQHRCPLLYDFLICLSCRPDLPVEVI